MDPSGECQAFSARPAVGQMIILELGGDLVRLWRATGGEMEGDEMRIPRAAVGRGVHPFL